MNHLGSAGIKSLVITVSTAFLFVVAVLLDLQYLYLMAVALAVLPLASFGLASFFATRFVVVREHSATVPEGRRIPVTLDISSQGGLPQASVLISDSLTEGLIPVEEESKSATRAGMPLDSWNGSSGMRTYYVEPEKRGVYKIGPAKLTTTDPLGLFTFSAVLPVETELVVLPEPLSGRDRSAGGEGAYGIRERDGKTRRGEGMEFHGVREYREGDALRRIHWATTARTGKLAVVEFERAYQQDIIIAIDLAKGTDYGSGRESSLEYAVKVAATLADRTLRAGGGIRLVTQHDNLVVKPQEADPQAARFRLFDRLARIRCDAESSLADALIGARSGNEDGAHYAILTAQGETRLLAFLSERVRHNDSVSVYFFEPSSFGGPKEGVISPAVAGASASLRVIECDVHSPWKEGGRHLEYILREKA